MEKWIEIRKGGNFAEWGKELGIDPLCARVIRNRGAETIDEARNYLEGDLSLLHDPFLLPDMDKAADGLLEAIDSGVKIRVVGDYDVDGVTSTYILVKGLLACGADVSYAIPHRLKDGYGINDEIVRDAANDGTGLIITCDNGIAAASQIALAYELGMKVIVTDHHQVPFTEEDGLKKEILPQCMAVVDPHREGSVYPYRGICGAMVAYKVLMALQCVRPSEKLEKVIDEAVQFAALGTACDVMDLCDENRIVVKEGLRKMAHTENKGLKALMTATSLNDSKLSAYSLSFVIGPCINSTGRLESAAESVGLLLSDDYDACLKTAQEIRQLNDLRKNMTTEGVKKALEIMESENMTEKKILVIYLPDSHESIAGLVAGKIKERFNRPVLVVTKGEEGLKGSGRSIPAYNMFEKMSEVKDLFTKFGGHAMAAGFSLEEENLGALSDKLNEKAALTDDDLLKEVRFDACVPLDYISTGLIRDLEKLEPVGSANPGAMFAWKDVEIRSASRMGKEGQYGRLTAYCNGRSFKLISFGDMNAFDSYIDSKYGPGTAAALYDGKGSIKLDICYEPGINEYKGNEYVDFKLKYYM
ncbi:MAG: single-stranded-DNA-specific exonuclease RecJ [Lachnospiraceae bacterium]|nr:single-stranded-DNA-specific exonuclease RecJ [Lachnospiraceae bacterium]